MGVIHTHSWSSGTVTKEPTCTEPGIKTYRCSCGETRTESIPALGHKWSDWTVVKEATETEDGLRERTCTVCDEKEVSIIPKIIILDNGDGTTTRTEEEPDGTIVKTTTGATDGSIKVDRSKTYMDENGNTVTADSSETFDKDGNSSHFEKKVEAVSEDGSVSSSATIVAGKDSVEIVTIVNAGSGVVSGDMIDKALTVQEGVFNEISEDVKDLTRIVRIGASDATLTLSQDSIEAVSESDSVLIVSSDVGSVTLPKQVMSGISGNGDVTISLAKAKESEMNDAQKAAVSDGTVVDVTIASEGISLGDSLGGTITLSVKHVPVDGKVPVAYFIADDGSKERMERIVYDSETGMVSFDTIHCSLYAIIDEDPESSDSSIVLYACIAIVALIAVAAVAMVARQRR